VPRCAILDPRNSKKIKKKQASVHSFPYSLNRERKKFYIYRSRDMKGIIYHVICVVAIVIVISACGGVSGTGGTGNREYNDMIDLDPPVLEEVRVASETTVEFCFGEEVRIVDDSLQISMPLEIDRYVSSDCGVVLHVSEEMQAGMKYTISFTVAIVIIIRWILSAMSMAIMVICPIL